MQLAHKRFPTEIHSKKIYSSAIHKHVPDPKKHRLPKKFRADLKSVRSCPSAKRMDPRNRKVYALHEDIEHHTNTPCKRAETRQTRPSVIGKTGHLPFKKELVTTERRSKLVDPGC
jgi:hypothetical protein